MWQVFFHCLSYFRCLRFCLQSLTHMASPFLTLVTAERTAVHHHLWRCTAVLSLRFRPMMALVFAAAYSGAAVHAARSLTRGLPTMGILHRRCSKTHKCCSRLSRLRLRCSTFPSPIFPSTHFIALRAQRSSVCLCVVRQPNLCLSLTFFSFFTASSPKYWEEMFVRGSRKPFALASRQR